MSFDYNVHNYTTSELESIFELEKKYEIIELQKQEKILRKNLLKDTTINNNIRDKIIRFIDEATVILQNNIQITDNKKHIGSTLFLEKMSDTYDNVFNLDMNLEPSKVVEAGDTIVINRPSTPYLNAQASEFFPGRINPLSRRILNQNINIDTRFRANYYTTLSTDFLLDLPIKLTKVVSLQLSAIELTNSFYVISSALKNNFFKIILQSTQDALFISIPDGNYDNITLPTYINSILHDPSNNVFNSIEMYVDSSCSGKTFFYTTDSTQPFSLNFLVDEYGYEDKTTELSLKFGWLLGYRKGYYDTYSTSQDKQFCSPFNNYINSSLATSEPYFYYSEGMFNLSGSNYIYMVIDDFNNSVNDGFISAFSSSIINKNVIARISNAQPTFNVNSQNNLKLITTTREYFGPVDIQKMNIQLLDEYGRILNLNNMDYSFCLSFQVIYDL
jgi:hypothetical protein